ncbi:MAG: hypothetical protein ACMUEM_01440 [Flavobacteriales bacterium AspAUS03]
MKTIIFLECNASGTRTEFIRLINKRVYRSLFLIKKKKITPVLPDNPVPLVDEFIKLNTNCVGSVLNSIETSKILGILSFNDISADHCSCRIEKIGVTRTKSQQIAQLSSPLPMTFQGVSSSFDRLR